MNKQKHISKLCWILCIVVGVSSGAKGYSLLDEKEVLKIIKEYKKAELLEKAEQISILDELFYSVGTDFFLHIEQGIFKGDELLSDPVSTALFHTFFMWVMTKNFQHTGAFSIRYKQRELVIAKGLVKTFCSCLMQVYAREACKNSSSPALQLVGGYIAGTMVRLGFEIMPRHYCLDFSAKKHKKRI